MLDFPKTGGTLVVLIPSVVLLSPVSQAESLSPPPLVQLSIPSWAVSSLVFGDISLGVIFLMALCEALALGLSEPARFVLLAGLSFLFRSGLLKFVAKARTVSRPL